MLEGAPRHRETANDVSRPGSQSPTSDRHHYYRHEASESSRHSNAADLGAAEQRIAKYLKHNPHDFQHVYKELEQLRKEHPREFQKDLSKINEDLHKQGLLPRMQIVEDDRVDAKHHKHPGFEVLAADKQNPKGNGTVVSSSHETPHESSKLRKYYHGMHYKHGHWNGWKQSAEGHGGAHGGFDRHSVGGHVPEGARKELIDKALQLAGVPVTRENEAAVNKIVQRESGWNPNITNYWDSNARAGHPSTGLMQTIPSTFKRFALPGMDNNIHDPLSNLVAGIRYAEQRYGRDGRSGVAVVASRSGGY